MKVTQVLALFAVLTVTASACGDKNKHTHDSVSPEANPENPTPEYPHGSVTDGSKIQHQEANNNGAEINDSSDNVANLGGLLGNNVDLFSSRNENIQISQTANQ